MADAQFSRRLVVTGLLLAPVAMSVLSPVAHAAAAAPAGRDAPRRSLDLNNGWRFQKGTLGSAQNPSVDDSGWDRVDLPHTWNAADGQDGGGNLVTGGNYFRGDGWYRRDLDIPHDMAGMRLFLEFDGANTTTDVWVNGIHIGQHKGGYARFRFDITDAAKPGRANVLAVRVNNAKDPDVAPLSADFTFFGGLYRGVRLRATKEVHVDLMDFGGPGVYLHERSVSKSSATVRAVTKLANDSATTRDVQVRVAVSGPGKDVVQNIVSPPTSVPPGSRSEITQEIHIGTPRLWNGRKDPYMYGVRAEVIDIRNGEIVDAVDQPLGLRSFTANPNDGFFLNGGSLPLRGVSRHQDRRDVGFAISDAAQEQDFALMNEMGVNALRTAHYEQAQKVYELADSLGILVYTEVPLVNEITDSAAFRANVKQQMRELIRQTYNHPSVAIWGIGNELGFHQRDKDPQTNALLAELAQIVRDEDPRRMSGYANVLARADDDPFTSHADLSGYNRYEGWYEGTTEMIGPWADALHTRNPQRMIGLTEYGAGANIHQHEEPVLSTSPDPFGPWHPEEYQSVFHESYLKQINARPFLWGTFVWNMFDFASDGRDEGAQKGINDKGLVTHDRSVKKDAFYWYKAHWSNEPLVHINSSRWTHRTVAATTVRVYSNASRVTLTVNGERIGSKDSDDRLFTWPVRLREGSNTVVAEAVINGVAHRDTCVWQLTAGG